MAAITRISTGAGGILRGFADDNTQLFSCSFLGGIAGYASYDEAVEGDMKSPIGEYAMLPGYIRSDRVTQPKDTTFILHTTHEHDGWCDDPAHPLYNQPVTLPFNASHEKMMRDDSAYDIVIPLSFNTDPVIPGKGSAIFFHLTPQNPLGTAGCIAIDKGDMLRLLPLLTPDTRMIIHG